MNPLRCAGWGARIGVSLTSARPVLRAHSRPLSILRLSASPPRCSLPTARIWARQFQHLANQPPKTDKDASAHTPTKSANKPHKKPEFSSDDAVHITLAEQRRKDWNIVKRLSVNLWPKNDWSTRSRVILGVGFLICGKVSQRGLAQRYVLSYR